MVTIPLIAAALYGSLRAYDQFEESRQFSRAAEQVAVLPMFAEFSTAVAGAAAATVLGLPTDNGVAVASEAETVLVDQIANLDLDPELRDSLNKVLVEGNSLLDSAVAGTMAPVVASERAQAFVTRVGTVFRAITAATPDPAVLEEGVTLLDMWTTQWSLLDQVVAYSALQDETEGSLLMWTNALGTDAAQLSILRETLASNESITDTSAIDALVAELDNRRTLTANLENSSGDTAALRNSIFTSLMVYIEEVRNSGTRIVGVLDDLAGEARTQAVGSAVGTVVVLALASGFAAMIATSLIRPLRRLRNDTLRAAEQGLPDAISAIKNGADIGTVTLPPVSVHTREEIGEVARAVDSMNEGALRLAGEQAQLRRQVNEMLETLSRRNKTLVEQQLSLIDSLEHEERDPTRLQNLFALDHLAARMRRTSDSLLVLAGTRQRMGRIPDTPLGDVLRAAVSQVENYQRVNVGNAPEGSLLGSSVTDVVHLVAELLDNALRASPPESTVAFAFSRAVDGGLLLEIADRGIGIPPDELAEINVRLGTDSETGSGAARRMGLFVVARLADRHGITVRLRPTFDSATNSGVTASVYLPIRLLKGTGSHTDPYQIDRPRRLPTPPGDMPEYSVEPYAAPQHSYNQGADESYGAPAENPWERQQPAENPWERQIPADHAWERQAPADNTWDRQAPTVHASGTTTPGASPGIRRGQLHERWVSRNNGE